MPVDVDQLTHVFIDLPYGIPRPLADLLARSKLKVIALDPIASGPFDLEIFVFDDGNAPSNGNVRIGLDYAIVRPEILSARSQVNNGGRVLVCLGGADVCSHGDKIASYLASSSIPTDWILGPLTQKPIRKIRGVETFRNPDQFPYLLSQCSWAVTNGGATAIELMCLGKAVHVVPQTDAEAHLACLFSEKHSILGIGLEALQPKQSSFLIEEVGRVASILIDGQGGQRIVEEALVL